MKKVLVYGWYGQGNIGDDLFIEAYHHLFPDIDFVFTDRFSGNNLQNVDAVFLGGGSFLLDHPNASNEAVSLLKQKKIFYLGVGVENDISSTHLELMKLAKVIGIRSPDQLERVKGINPNTYLIPDLVYSLQSHIPYSARNNSVLVVPNISVVPNNSDPYWKHASWNYFKSEFSQFLDWLVENDYKPQLFSMCHGLHLDDSWAISELVSHMNRRSRNRIIHHRPSNITDVAAVFAQYSVVITQRFHGIVLAEMTRTPYIAIHHHDKLKLSSPNEGIFISYYNSSKHGFIDAFNQAKEISFSNALPIKSDTFEALVKEVTSFL